MLIPQVVGAINGTHIEILPPEGDNKVDYYSRKQKYTINTQAVVGANLVFLDIATGYPGSIHDARVLRTTSLYRKSERHDILAAPCDVVNGLDIRPLLISDGAYPPTTWSVKPFPFRLNLSNAEKKFNHSLSSARVTVERAFGILKSRWRCLLKRLDNRAENISSVIITCCVLHNICQINSDFYIDDDDIVEIVIAQEQRARRKRARNRQVCNNSNALRNALKDYVNQ